MPTRRLGLLILGLVSITFLSGLVGFWLFSPTKPKPKQLTEAIPAPAEAEVNIPARAPIPVDSRGEDQRDLAAWKVAAVGVGYIDGVWVSEQAGEVRLNRPIKTDDVLIARGWTGDPAFGVQASRVYLETCGTIFASSTPDRGRPDVAKLVHPNLVKSGWQVKFAAAHMPRCADPVIKAWSVFWQFDTLFPASNISAYQWQEPDNTVASVTEGTTVSFGPPQEAPQVTPIEISGKQVNLRRCAGETCQVLTTIPGGKRDYFLVEQQSDWLLVIVPDQDPAKRLTGWLSTKVAKVIKTGNGAAPTAANNGKSSTVPNQKRQ